MLIHIISGIYGHHREGGYISPKTRLDPPFEVDDAEAERLVSLGVAEYAGTQVATHLPEPEEIEPEDDTVADENAAENVFDTMTKAELVAYAKDAGIEIPKRASKADIIDAIMGSGDDFDPIDSIVEGAE